MRDRWFEWDDAKAKRKYLKHGVRFEDARLAFDDPFGVVIEDIDPSYQEERYLLIGDARGRLVSVVHTFRGVRIRIISARGAERREKRQYQKGGG